MKYFVTRNITLIASVFLFANSLFLTSCSKLDVGGINGTYLIICADDGTSPDTNQKYYKEIDKAISNNELLYTYHGYSSKYYDKYYYASRDLFVSNDGGFATQDIHTGRFYNTICWWLQGYQIINNNTILWVDYQLFDDISMTHNMTKFKNVYNGTNLKLSWYKSETYYTYYRNDGKLYLSNGKILTITDAGLVKDGSSTIYKQFDLDRLK